VDGVQPFACEEPPSLQFGSRPYRSISPNTVPEPFVESLPPVGTYTFPFATVGTVNFTALPAASPGTIELFHNSFPRFVDRTRAKSLARRSPIRRY